MTAGLRRVTSVHAVAPLVLTNTEHLSPPASLTPKLDAKSGGLAFRVFNTYNGQKLHV